MIVANAMNGLVYPHDEICYFQSQYGHHASNGYFRIDSMPIRVLIHLLQGGEVELVDGRRRPGLTDAFRFGVPTWCLTINRALGFKEKVCPWQTREMEHVAGRDLHHATRATTRKFAKVYGFKRPFIIGDNIKLTVHRCVHDDNVRRIKKLLGTRRFQLAGATLA